MSCYPDRDPMITDVCVPLTQLPVLIDSTKRMIDEMTIPCPIIAHAGRIHQYHYYTTIHSSIQSSSFYPSILSIITTIILSIDTIFSSYQSKYLYIFNTHDDLLTTGDGNFHVLIFFDPSNPDEVNQAKKLSSYMALEAIKLDGTCTGEHGIGTGKKEYLQLEMGEGTMRLMGTIKTAMDPHNILNPGKILDVKDCNSSRSSSSSSDSNSKNE